MKQDPPVLDHPPGRPGPGEDRALVEAFDALAGGDLSALDVVWDRAGARLHGLALWRTGNVEDAADVVQDVFVRLAAKASTLGAARSPTAWLLTVTRRMAVDHVRRKKVRATSSLSECEFLVDPGGNAAGIAEAKRASRLLGKLPPEQREAIFLRIFAGCTFAEIGRITGKPRFTAAGRYRAGIDKLRKLLERGTS